MFIDPDAHKYQTRFGRAVFNLRSIIQVRLRPSEPRHKVSDPKSINPTPNRVTDCFVFVAVLKLNCPRKAKDNGC